MHAPWSWSTLRPSKGVGAGFSRGPGQATSLHGVKIRAMSSMLLAHHHFNFSYHINCVLTLYDLFLACFWPKGTAEVPVEEDQGSSGSWAGWMNHFGSAEPIRILKGKTCVCSSIHVIPGGRALVTYEVLMSRGACCVAASWPHKADCVRAHSALKTWEGSKVEKKTVNLHEPQMYVYTYIYIYTYNSCIIGYIHGMVCWAHGPTNLNGLQYMQIQLQLW